MISIDALKTASQTLQSIRREAENNKSWGFDMPWDEFFIAMSCLNPQSYGARIQNRLAKALNLKKSPKNKGDFQNGTRIKSLECKGSLITSSNSALNLVQIRPWQQVDYICWVADIREPNNVVIYYLYLTHKEMCDELNICNVSNAHGTCEANVVNTNIELALRMEFGDKIFKRWADQYNINLYALKDLLK